MSVAEKAFDADYARAYGQHDFTAVSGEVVSVLSEPDWDSFYSRLESANHLGTLVLSPELITSSVISPAELKAIPARQAEIEGRVSAVQALSLRRPDATIVLGTATFNNQTSRPANSQVFISNGSVVAQTNKGFSIYQPELQVFTLREAQTATTIDRRLAGMVCSDILRLEYAPRRYFEALRAGDSGEPDSGPKITEHTETVLLSSCWAIPLDGPAPGAETSPDYEDRFRRQLEGRISSLFRRNPALMEVIVADRLAAISGVDAPYNGHFTRRPE